MTVTATLVKEMRERTGLGMMECKRALEDTQGDIDAAIEKVRKSGQAQADKKAGRIAAEGVVALASDTSGTRHALVEINCETDFVAKDGGFLRFCEQAARVVVNENPRDLAALLDAEVTTGESLEHARQQLVARVGENVQVRRFVVVESSGCNFGLYRHGTRIGVIVAIKGGEAELGKDIAMHVAASRPLSIDVSGIPAQVLEKERRIYAAQAAESGKPEAIQQKMVAGKVSKYIADATLLGQDFVKLPDTKVAEVLNAAGARIERFERMEVGEGIQKPATDFVAEVLHQAAS